MITLHVCPRGDDRHTGRAAETNANSKDGPLATLAGARDAVRALRTESGHADTPVTVLIHGGTYPLAEPVTFTDADSGPTTYAAAPGETPVFDGGVEVTGWAVTQLPNPGGAVTAWVCDVAALLDRLPGRHFRSLFVDGVRAERTRVPEEGYWTSRGAPDAPAEFELFAGSDRVILPPGCFDPAWRNPTDIELRVLHLWVDERMPVRSYDAESHVLTSTHRSVMMLSGKDSGWNRERLFVENVFEALRRPGQFYLDRAAATLYYVPRPGQTPGRTRVVVPVVTQFLRLEGDVERDRPVRGLTFHGLTFRHGDWVQPADDWGRRFDPQRPAAQWKPRDAFRHFVEADGIDPARRYATVPQAAFHVPGVVHFFGAHGCALERCTVERVGFTGVELADGCRDCRVVGNTLEDLGAGGVTLDGADLGSDPRRFSERNQIEGNRITHAGRVFLAACGILLMHARDNHVARNEVGHLHYSGISVGWTWLRRQHVAVGNVIEFNHVHHVGGRDVLADLGGIYTLGIAPGSVLRGNHVHDITADAYGGWGIYTDASSAGLVIEDNHVHDTRGPALNINTGNCENLARGNRLEARHAPAVGVARRPGDWAGPLQHSRALTFVGNTVVTHGQPVFSMRAHEGGALRDYLAAVCSDANTFWDATAAGPPVLLVDWQSRALCDAAAWQAAGHDRCSRFEAPPEGGGDPASTARAAAAQPTSHSSGCGNLPGVTACCRRAGMPTSGLEPLTRGL